MRKFLYIIIINYTLLIANCYTQWVQQTLPIINHGITGIKFTDNQNGWACTDGGTPTDSAFILHSTNGGTNWFIQLSAYNNNFTDINFINSTTGYVCGADNNIGLYKLFSTTNGGNNWSSLTMVPNMRMYDM